MKINLTSLQGYNFTFVFLFEKRAFVMVVNVNVFSNTACRTILHARHRVPERTSI